MVKKILRTQPSTEGNIPDKQMFLFDFVDNFRYTFIVYPHMHFIRASPNNQLCLKVRAIGHRKTQTSIFIMKLLVQLSSLVKKQDNSTTFQIEVCYNYVFLPVLCVILGGVWTCMSAHMVIISPHGRTNKSIYCKPRFLLRNLLITKLPLFVTPVVSSMPS